MGHNSLDYVHAVTEAMKLAFADRERYYGDPRFVDVPIERLLSDSYARGRRAMVITIANSLSALDRRYEEAAQALGAGPVRTFLHVTLPLSTPGVASGMLLVFLLTLSAYVTITLLGGPRSKLLVSMNL